VCLQLYFFCTRQLFIPATHAQETYQKLVQVSGTGTSFLHANEHSSIPAQKLSSTWREPCNVIGRWFFCLGARNCDELASNFFVQVSGTRYWYTNKFLERVLPFIDVAIQWVKSSCALLAVVNMVASLATMTLNTVKHYFNCILILRFWSAEISLHFNLAFLEGVLC